MKCEKCLREWSDEQNFPSCPFCGEAVNDTCPEFSSATDALKYMVKTYGEEIFLNPPQAISLFSDFAPGLSGERRLLKFCFELDIVKEIINRKNEDEKEKEILVGTYISKLQNRYFVSREWAENCIGWLECAFGWKKIIVKITLENGALYEGESENGKPTGRGKITYPSGHVLSCTFVNGVPNGEGEVVWNISGIECENIENKWQGTWENGLPWNGKGTYIFGDFEEITTVPIVNGKKEGKGIILYKNGEKYVGSVKNGAFSGANGYLKKVDGTTFVGEFQSGSLVKGFEFDAQNKLVNRFGNGYILSNV